MELNSVLLRIVFIRRHRNLVGFVVKIVIMWGFYRSTQPTLMPVITPRPPVGATVRPYTLPIAPSISSSSACFMGIASMHSAWLSSIMRASMVSRVSPLGSVTTKNHIKYQFMLVFIRKWNLTTAEPTLAHLYKGRTTNINTIGKDAVYITVWTNSSFAAVCPAFDCCRWVSSQTKKAATNVAAHYFFPVLERVFVLFF